MMYIVIVNTNDPIVAQTLVQHALDEGATADSSEEPDE